MMASDFSMRAKWRALKSGWRSAPQKVLDRGNIVRDGDAEWRRKYVHLAMRRDPRIAKVAMARKLAVSLFWMWRKEWNYEQVIKFGSHAGQSDYVHGVK